ncbi:MAG: hypothetical protein M3N24_08675, partial [Actinomycetota bacterium]|nr:hypothetical protein [Actinomycetota bacterium]
MIPALSSPVWGWPIGVALKIAVIGTGHVGLVTCATLANCGHEVRATDTDHQKMALLK